MEKQLILEIKQSSIHRLNESTRMLEIALKDVNDIMLWKKPNTSLNSIGNLLLHLCGNITQYSIAALGQRKDTRQRDSEFSTTGGYSKEQLLNKLNNTLSLAKKTIKTATLEQLLLIREVQGFPLSGIGIIMHVVEHYSYHTGQIAFWVKQQTNKDLGFYKNIDLNTGTELFR